MNPVSPDHREGADSARGNPRGVGRFEHLRRCLGWRLVFFLAASLFVLMGARDWVSMRMQRQQMEQQLEDRGVDVGETLLSSLRAAMLANDWPRLEQTLEDTARLERVAGARIIGKDGRVGTSADAGDIGMVYSLDEFACRNCHVGVESGEVALARGGRHAYGIDLRGGVLSLAMPIPNETSCSEADCHAHDAEQTVLGVLDMELSTASIQAALAAQRDRLLLLDALTLLLICTAVGILAWRLVHVPLHEVVAGTKRIGAGDLGHRLREDRSGELQDLAVAFNRMTAHVERAREELEGWNQHLEERVAEKTRELEQARDHMVFTEKMASLGRLAAVVAHEINNPLAGILVSVRVLRKKLARVLPDEESREKFDSSLAMIERETSRSGDIVRNLLFFSRQREPTLAPENLREIVERAIGLVAHQAELNGVTMSIREDDRLEELDCDANQIQQACIVALLNAIDAMPDGGEIVVGLRDCRNENVCIEIRDTGCGIPKELQMKVFEPFFSTKPEGEGTGLGLSVLYGIVRRHGGRVELESEEGAGTLVRMRLPRRPDPVKFSHPEDGS
jgi:two-component system NtrC family sensor kinase